MKTRIEANTGSFRDPVNRVYEVTPMVSGGKTRILRGLNKDALAIYQQLSGEAFFQEALDACHIVQTELLATDDEDARAVMEEGWAGVLKHYPIPFVTYPYEWTFSMLKDAALLQLYLIEKSLENGWTLKDATPYNIQWIGPRPVFIDVPSFQPWEEGEPWVGYRQFCSMFLTPLMVRAHLDIDHLPILRSYIDGIPPMEAIKYFTGTKRFKTGVLSHIVFPAKVENSIAKRERDNAPAQQRTSHKQSKAMVLGLVQSLARLVRKLSIEIKHTDWSKYDKTHSYSEADLDTKKAFVLKHAATNQRNYIWDIGCNTGTFSRVASQYCSQVIAVDGDHDAVEQIYLAEKMNTGSNILPLVMNLANISPGQGWGGNERQAFDQRRKPDLVLCLALIHHVRMSANIPNALFLKWLHSLQAAVILEFVHREDEMVVKLLTNKKEQYEDYTLGQFTVEAERFFTIKDHQSLKGGKREMFYFTPR
ncbi:MAG TPA: class I SAM-dependent methyltransferase [Gammaproteobacteria bacterium]|nr:class I SAM-dependent methyltransferase [Gammaproteobacteria bacterium]HIL95066.1 class I SAM-dependent methyltransferase [Pseudomonadales bacterium]